MTDSELTFSIAGMATRLNFQDGVPEYLHETLGYYRDFEISSSSKALQIAVRIEEGDFFFEQTPGPLEIRTRSENGRVSFLSFLEQGWFDLQRRGGELVLRPKGNPENFLRVLYAYRCLEQQALLLHAAGVIRDGSAYVFFGPSGSGKTTSASLSPESTVLSDDLVLIQVEPAGEQNQVRAYGVPFRGTLVEAGRTNASAAVKGIYRLHKAQHHQLEQLPVSKGISELAASIPFIMTQPSNAVRVLQICEKIEHVIPVQNLFFRKDPGFWDVIEKI